MRESLASLYGTQCRNCMGQIVGSKFFLYFPFDPFDLFLDFQVGCQFVNATP